MSAGIMAYMLSIDTALGETSLALSKEKEIARHAHHPARDQQARMLVTWIETILKQENIWYSDLSGLAVCIGPGGFTGIRIGLATARAVALAANIPIAGYSTLEIIAHYAACTHSEKKISALLPAGRGMVFQQSFEIVDFIPHATSAPEMMLPEACPSYGMTASTDAALTPACLVPLHTNATTLAHLATLTPERFSNASPAPLYIRPPDAKPQAALL